MTTPQGANFKIVLLGEGRVGKTSLTLRYCEDKFSENQVSTVQASFLRKRIAINNQRVNLAIWDTAGQEKFHALGPIYYRDADGALLVYDVSDKDSFIKVKNWVKELRTMLGKDIVLAIAGNKIDLNRSVTLEEAESYAESVGAKHFSTSAKLNKGIQEVFFDLAKRMLQNKGQQKSTAGGGGTYNEVTIGSDEPAPNSDGGCC